MNQDQEHKGGPISPARFDAAMKGQEVLAQVANDIEAKIPAIILEAQRNALAEARQRIIARCDQVEATVAPFLADGLHEARRIIGAMWDELPVSKPLAVIEHEAKAAAGRPRKIRVCWDCAKREGPMKTAFMYAPSPLTDATTKPCDKCGKIRFTALVEMPLLEPCPHCGGPGEDIATPPAENTDVIRCAECMAETAGHEPGTGGHVKAWNDGEVMTMAEAIKARKEQGFS